MKDFVVIPTYNESGNIRELIYQIFSLYPRISVLVVDDNSPDGTAHIVKELQKKHSELYLLEREGKLGLSTAYIEGIQKVLKEHAETRSITTMDSDLSHDPRVIGSMHQMLDTNDLVIGSRYVRGGKLVNWPLSRKILSICGNAYATSIVGIRVKDLTAGFQCFNTSLLKKYNFKAITAKGFSFQMEMKVAAVRLGARVAEIPITFANRVWGKSKISKNIIYEGLIMPWKFRTIWRDKKYGTD